MGTLDGPLAAAGGNEEVHHAGRQEGQHGEGHTGGDVDEELGDNTGQRHALIVGSHHQAHNARVERELQQDAGGTGSSIAEMAST